MQLAHTTTLREEIEKSIVNKGYRHISPFDPLSPVSAPFIPVLLYRGDLWVVTIWPYVDKYY